MQLTAGKMLALTKANELRVFSPPDKLEIFFQLFFGGLTLTIKMMQTLRLVVKFPNRHSNNSEARGEGRGGMTVIVVFWKLPISDG